MKLCMVTLALALELAGAAWADEPVASAGGAPGAQTTAEQVDAYIKATPAPELADELASGAVTGKPGDRAVHGVVELGVGTNGYRRALVGADIPLGWLGSLSVLAGQAEAHGRFGAYGAPDINSHFGFGAVGPRCQIGDLADLAARESWSPPQILPASGCRGAYAAPPMEADGDDGR